MNSISVYIFKVGHGDNILLKLPNGSWGLIDFFYSEEQNEPPSVTFLKNISNKERVIIDFVHITHFHADHIKGLDSLFSWIHDKKITLKEFWLPGIIRPKEVKETINSLIHSVDIVKMAKERKSIEKLSLTQSKYYLLNKEIEKNKTYRIKELISCQFYNISAEKYRVLCVSPNADTVSKIIRRLTDYMRNMLESVVKSEPHIDENSLSTILKIFLPDFKNSIKLTFGGDTTKNGWNEGFKSFKSQPLPDYHSCINSFIKVSHHGSRHSSSLEIWRKLLNKSDLSEVHIFYSSGSLEYPDDETIQHINLIAKEKDIDVIQHSTNKKVQAKKYDPEQIDLTDTNLEEVNARVDTYPGSKSYIVDEKFAGYKFNIDNKSSKVYELLRL